MSNLFSQLVIKSVSLRNRLVVSPMCQYSAVDGFANDWHLVHLGSRAVGGAALVIQEATAITPEGRITPSDLGLYNESHVEKLQSIARFIHEQGAVAGIQLAHAGRKGGCAVPWNGGRQLKINQGGWETVSASALPFDPNDDAPQALDSEGILRIISGFRFGAQRAAEAGYRVVEIHAARVLFSRLDMGLTPNKSTDNQRVRFF